MRKLLIIVVVGILAIGIPLGIYLSQQQQDIRQRAATSGSGTDTCGLLQIEPVEVTACPDLSSDTPMVDITEYKMDFLVKNIDTIAHTITYVRQSYFCPDGEIIPCVENGDIKEESTTLEPGETKTISVNRSNPNPGGGACGTFQSDFTIDSIEGKPGCTYNDFSKADKAGWGICQTGKDCAIPTPTVTVSPTITPTGTPPVCPIPENVQNVKITCPNCSG